MCDSIPDINKLILEAKVHNGVMWILSQENEIYKLNLSTFVIENSINFFNGELIAVRDFYIDKIGNVWIATIKGLYIYNHYTSKIMHYTSSTSNIFNLPNNSIWTICEDWQRNIWIGTFSGGLCYVNLDEKKPFETYLPKEDKLSHAPISAFTEDENNIWIGTEGRGLNCLNKSTKKITYYTSSDNNGIASDNIKSLVIDKNKNLWISMFNGGLDLLELKNNKIHNFKHNETKNSILENNIRKLILESDSGIWIAYQKKQLIISYYSFKNQKFNHYNISESNREQYIFDILRANENNLWILSNENLYLMDVKTCSVKQVEKNDSTFLNFRTFCLDNSENIWIGTVGNGLLKYNTKSSKFQSFNNALLDNMASVYNICYVNDSNLWLGTDNGLIKYSISENNFSEYSVKDGTQGQVYYPLSSMKGTDGKLYFGGTNGFTIIDTEKVNQNRYKPNIIISDFLIDHKSAKLTLENSLSKEITLEYDQINFGFQFSSDNYLIPEKNQFKYRLKGYDNNWIEVNASNRTALYSKVPAGTYYFELLASNNDGVWSSSPTVIKVKRKSAPWVSWYAYVIYFIAIVLFGYLIFSHYKEKEKLKLQLYLENAEKDKKEQIHQAQLRFFTNISHDFRTPLSLIIAAIDRLRQDGLKEYYYRILNSNSKRLLNLINELMDFRTIENREMKLAIEQVDANMYIEELASDFVDYAKQQSIQFSIKCDPLLPKEIYIDKQIVEKTIMNLLNNAFRYTEKGTISIETYASAKDFSSQYQNNHILESNEFPQNAFAIVVRDTGVGISKKSITSVFERFYKVNTVNTNSHLGTGIGLALVKNLVLLHKGAIQIYSERDKGTDIVIFLTLNKEKYNVNDFIEIENTQKKEPNVLEFVSDQTSNLQIEENILLRNKKRILFAEDNEDLRILISGALSDEYEVIQASNGALALELINSMTIDIIVSDIMMPQKDGVALCNHVKNNINTLHIPIILLTAKTSVESKIEGLNSGADIYLEKPIDINLLRLSIQNIFKHQKQLKEYYAKNYFVESAELSSNGHDNKFLMKFIEILEDNISQSEMDVNYIASQLSMSRSKLYTKIKTLTDKSIVEFILNYRLRKAAKLIIEKDLTMREVMLHIGIESQSYFTNAFKKEFGQTPTSFASKYKVKNKN